MLVNNTLIDCNKEQNLNLDNINAHKTFFDFLSNSCERESISYLSWKSTPNKNTMCSDFEIKWKDLIGSLKSKSDNKVKKCFEKLTL